MEPFAPDPEQSTAPGEMERQDQIPAPKQANLASKEPKVQTGVNCGSVHPYKGQPERDPRAREQVLLYLSTSRMQAGSWGS